MILKLGRTKKLINVGKFCGKYDILKDEEKGVSLIGNKIKKSLRQLHGKKI